MGNQVEEKKKNSRPALVPWFHHHHLGGLGLTVRPRIRDVNVIGSP